MLERSRLNVLEEIDDYLNEINSIAKTLRNLLIIKDDDIGVLSGIILRNIKIIKALNKVIIDETEEVADIFEPKKVENKTESWVSKDAMGDHVRL